MTVGGRAVRWGILGAANIARASFLPALREAGDGTAVIIASRKLARAQAFAERNEIQRAVTGYQNALDDPAIDAVYIALPNSLHAEWTKKALLAGKCVLTEKPLCASPEQARDVLSAAEATGGLLWEAFVFPFQDQFRRLTELLEAGTIGELREVQSSFHFLVRSRENIRLQPVLDGGALNDVGYYPVHLARLLFDGVPTSAAATWRLAEEGVDEEAHGILGYEGGRTLLFSCGMARPYDTATRLLGTAGEIHMRNPFHPGPEDALEIRGEAGVVVERPTRDRHSFTAVLSHIHAVLRGAASPQGLARDTAYATALAMQMVRDAARTPRA